MVMSFADSPVRLRQWEITTKTGQRTRVELLDYATGVRLDPSLFNLELAAANATASSPPGRPVLRRVEVDERRPARRRHLGDELRRLAQHLAGAAVALRARPAPRRTAGRTAPDAPACRPRSTARQISRPASGS